MASQQHERAEARKAAIKADRAERSVVAVASAKFCRVPARKARLLADMIRGMSVVQAFTALKFTHRPSAKPIVERLLKSAVSNVDGDHGDTDDLIVGTIMIDDAGMLKRWQPRAMGRASRIKKRLCHISMELIER